MKCSVAHRFHHFSSVSQVISFLSSSLNCSQEELCFCSNRSHGGQTDSPLTTWCHHLTSQEQLLYSQTNVDFLLSCSFCCPSTAIGPKMLLWTEYRQSADCLMCHSSHLVFCSICIKYLLNIIPECQRNFTLTVVKVKVPHDVLHRCADKNQ